MSLMPCPKKVEPSITMYVKGRMMFDHCKSDGAAEIVSETAAFKTQVLSRPQIIGVIVVVCLGTSIEIVGLSFPKMVLETVRMETGNSGGRGGGDRRDVTTNNTEVDDVEVGAFQVRVMSSNVSGVEGNAEESLKVCWILDSGCTDHIVVSDRYFCEMSKLDTPANIKVADGFIVKG